MGKDYLDTYSVCVKEKFSSIRRFCVFAIASFCILSIGYFIFWLGAISDDIFFSYGKHIFEPLAKFLNMGDTSLNIYLNTSFMLIGAIFPALIIQYFMDKVEEALIKDYETKQEKKHQKELIEERKSYMARFDSIKTYSICLSVDYEFKKQTANKNKTTLNNGIYSKLADLLKAIEPNSSVSVNDVLIFTSHNFSNYDFIYDSLLNALSKIKNVIEKKYDCKLIPSITTDAYSGILGDNNIRRQHFEIQSFNFKNKALTTASFSDKYKHLRHKKYAGIPIGQYAYFEKEKSETYELNVIYKNLSKVLA